MKLTKCIIPLMLLLSGCSRPTPVQPYAPRETVVLDVMCEREDWDIVTELCSDFSQQHREKNYAFTLDVLPKDVTAALSDGSEQADVLCFRSDMTAELAESGVLLPLTEYGKEAGAERLGMSMKSAEYGGELYGFPYAADTCFLYYNRSLLSAEEAADLNIIMSKVMDTEYSLAMPLESGYYQSAFFLGTGCDIPNGCCSERGMLAGEYMAALTRCGRFAADCDSDDIKAGFVSGDIAAAFCNMEICEELRSTLGRNYATAMLPRMTLSDGSTVQLGSLASFMLAGVSADTANPEDAALFAQYLSSEKAQQMRLTQRNFAPVMVSLCSEKSLQKEYPEVYALLNQLNYAQLLPPTEKLRDFNAAAETLCDILLDGDVTRNSLEEALRNFP